jgi:hypothetical protein
VAREHGDFDEASASLKTLTTRAHDIGELVEPEVVVRPRDFEELLRVDDLSRRSERAQARSRNPDRAPSPGWTSSLVAREEGVT